MALLNPRFRNFCFTINNYLEDQILGLPAKLDYTYLVMGKEIGDSGTPHVQGYCELSKRLSLKHLKAIMPTAHIENRYSTAKHAATYCKKDGQFAEFGLISRQGKRNDIEDLYCMVKEGENDINIGETYPASYVKYYKAVDRIRFNYAQCNNLFEKIEVIVLYGKSGVGKTRAAYEMDPNLFTLASTLSYPWFDGYFGQKTLLIDDYYGHINWSLFLRLLDGYKFSLPVKGGHTWKSWTKVIITSNQHPRNWYEEKGFPLELSRRITLLEEVAI